MDRRKLALIFVITLSTFIGACARTVVRPDNEMTDLRLPQPQQILVYDFATHPSELSENSTSGSSSRKETSEISGGDRAVAQQAANAFAEELVQGLRGLGFSVERRPRGTPVGRDQLLIDGMFVDVDEGNRLQRIVIGFGSGASKVDTKVYVDYGPSRRRMLDFSTHADSGKMPGAAAGLGAGAIVTGGVTAGSLAVGAASGTVKEYHSEVERMAAKSADQAVAYLSEFFAKQGWISPDQVKQPKLER